MGLRGSGLVERWTWVRGGGKWDDVVCEVVWGG